MALSNKMAHTVAHDPLLLPSGQPSLFTLVLCVDNRRSFFSLLRVDNRHSLAMFPRPAN